MPHWNPFLIISFRFVLFFLGTKIALSLTNETVGVFTVQGRLNFNHAARFLEDECMRTVPPCLTKPFLLQPCRLREIAKMSVDLDRIYVRTCKAWRTFYFCFLCFLFIN
jgi:hypothetical protein